MNEKQALRKFLELCQKEAPGCTFTIDVGGEAPEIANSTDLDAVIEASNATGMDTLEVNGADGKRLGWFTLIWGNDPSGEELVADYGMNKFSDKVWEIWSKLFEN